MVVDSPNSTNLEDSCTSSHLEQAQSSSSAELDETTESSLEARCTFCSSANNPIHKYSTRKGSYVWRHRCRNKRCTRFFGDVYVDRSGSIKASNEAKHSLKDSQISVGKPSISEKSLVDVDAAPSFLNGCEVYVENSRAPNLKTESNDDCKDKPSDKDGCSRGRRITARKTTGGLARSRPSVLKNKTDSTKVGCEFSALSNHATVSDLSKSITACEKSAVRFFCDETKNGACLEKEDESSLCIRPCKSSSSTDVRRIEIGKRTSEAREAEGISYVSTEVQTNSTLFTMERLLDEWTNKAADSVSSHDDRFLSRRMKIAPLLIQSQKDIIERLREKNRQLLKLNESIMKAFEEQKRRMIDTTRNLASDLCRVRDDVQSMSGLARLYHLDLIKALDACDVKAKRESREFAEKADRLENSHRLLKGVVMQKESELSEMRRLVDDKTRELLSVTRDLHIANERINSLEKKGSIDVSQPVSNLANTTAGQTDVIAQSLALREEMRAKAEKMDMAAKNMAKEVERLKRELQHVTFERDAWRSDSKRLDIQVQRLRAQQNSVDSPEESAASTNSMTPSDSSSSMDRQCLEDFRFSSDRVTSSTMCPSAVMKNGKLQNKGDERKQFRSQPLPAFSHTSTLRCPAATSSAKCSPQRADSEASKSSRLSPCDDGRRLRGDITGIGDSKLHAALDHHMLPVQSSRCRRENRDRSRPAQVGGQKTEISSTTTASLSCDRQDRNPTENDMDMNAKSKMHSPIAVNSHKCSVTGKEACEQQTSKTHRVPSTLRALKRPRTSSSDSPQEMSMKRKENNSKIDVEVEKQNSARLPWHKPTSPQPQTLSQAKILAPDESDNEFTERSRSRRSSSVYRSSRGGARKNKIPSVFRSVIPWNSDANSSISPLLSTPSSCSLRRKRNEYGVDKITDAEVPKRIKSPTHEWSDSKERRGRSLSPRARSPVVRLTTDTKWARRGSRYFGERELTESVRRDVSVSSWSRPHNYSRRSGTPRSRH